MFKFYQRFMKQIRREIVLIYSTTKNNSIYVHIYVHWVKLSYHDRHNVDFCKNNFSFMPLGIII